MPNKHSGKTEHWAQSKKKRQKKEHFCRFLRNLKPAHFFLLRT